MTTIILITYKIIIIIIIVLLTSAKTMKGKKERNLQSSIIGPRSSVR